MFPIENTRLTRRFLLKAALASATMLSTASLSRAALAEAAADAPFAFDAFAERMRLRAAEPYKAVPPALPEVYAGLDYDGYRMVQFNAERAHWLDKQSGYQLHAFALGWLFKEPVEVFEIVDGIARPAGFVTEDFHFFDGDMRARADAEPFPGVAGIRVNYPLNAPDRIDELISFLGASYFRALGRNNIYGLSARGLVINSWREGPEEFPRFSEFYVEHPKDGGPLVIYAALDSASVTGAFRFAITPASDAAQETVMGVTSRLFFRQAVTELGVAPLTSMFLFAETNRGDFDDYRPQVHDSNGLVFEGQGGQPMWRALDNSAELGNSYLWDPSVKAFGLYQRDRNFETYQDAGAHYERRPSVRVEPIGEWGEGSVRLIEMPSRLEVNDNIVAFWIPAEPVKAGDAREYSYRLIWGDLLPEPNGPLGHVVETRAGRGGVSGVDNGDTLRKFVVDFAGGELDALAPDAKLDVVAEASGGTLKSSTLSRIAANGAWRLVLDIDTAGQSLIELKATLARDDKPLTETWLYQWRGAHT
jgi:periplasmic glucans biosynthesis protein